MIRQLVFIITLGLSATFATAKADTIHLTNGRSLEAVVLKESGNEYLIRTKCMTVILNKSEIKSIEKSHTATAKRSLSQRLPDWAQCLDIALSKEWGTNLQPIPATVIDKGILRHVPYASFRSGKYELNVYGNPDQPACVEIGIYQELLKDKAAKANCLEFVLEVLNDPQDRALLKGLNHTQDKKERNGLTFEVTPETAEDAYGGWWLSVYDEKLLDKSRASDKELHAITVRREDVKKVTGNLSKTDISDWSSNDLRFARPSLPSTPIPSPAVSASSGTSGRVYVRGYHRKDGTYVRPHTRSRPSK